MKPFLLPMTVLSGITRGVVMPEQQSVTGAVAEQRTKLDHGFRQFGETPDNVLDVVAQQATAWFNANSESHVPSLQLSEWIYDIVSGSVEPAIESLRNVGKRAISSLEEVATEMGRSDASSQEDYKLLLQDLPRFELEELPNPISVGHWKLWGEGVLRSHIRSNLRQSIGHHLKEELHLYGMALSHWSEQIVRKLEALVSSYADAYRVQLHRISGGATAAVDLELLEADLELLQRREVETNERI